MITREMVKYFLKNTSESEIINDFKDLANGKYSTIMLRKDISQTWNIKRFNIKTGEKK